MAVGDFNFTESPVWTESISTFSIEGSATMGRRGQRNENGKQMGCWNNGINKAKLPTIHHSNIPLPLIMNMLDENPTTAAALKKFRNVKIKCICRQRVMHVIINIYGS